MGYWANSGESVVGTADGVFRTRTVHRKPEEHCWTSESLQRAVGTPLNTMPGKSKDDGENCRRW